MNPQNLFTLNTQIEQLLNNSISSLQRANLGFNTASRSREDKIDAAAGYPADISTEDYYRQWKRNGVAKRVITAYPDGCWKQSPDVYETDDNDVTTAFESSWNDVEKRVKLLSAMATADALCGIGRFGIMLLGVDDGKELHEPIEGYEQDPFEENPGPASPTRKINFVRSISERFVRIEKIDYDPTSPRYGLPVTYAVELNGVDDGTEVANQQAEHYQVHWHRVVHVTEVTDETLVFSTPRLQPVYNDILDIHKVAAASPEAYWQGSYPGLTFKLDPGYEGLDETGITKQMEEYAENMRRYISTVGVTVNTLAPVVVDPLPHVNACLSMISIGTGIPKRILQGTEEGVLAGNQDGASWADRIQGRREHHLTPNLVLRVVHKLQSIGVLSAAPEGVKVVWPNPHTMSETEQADVAAKRSEAIARYVASGAENLMAFGDFLHLILKMPIEEVRPIVDKLENEDDVPGLLSEIEFERAEHLAEIKQQFSIKPEERETGKLGKTSGGGEAPARETDIDVE